LLDTAALFGNCLMALGGNRLYTPRLVIHLAHGLPHTFDQHTDLRHAGIEYLAQLGQLVATVDTALDSQVAGSHMLHGPARDFRVVRMETQKAAYRYAISSTTASMAPTSRIICLR